MIMRIAHFIPILLLLWTQPFVAYSYLIGTTPPLVIPQCSTGLYWDTIQLQCSSCASNQVVGPAYTCICAVGYYRTASTRDCAACPSGQYATTDETFCVTCPTASNTSELERTGSQCRCGPREYLSVNRTTNTATCAPCSSNSYPSLDLSTCIYCPNPSMFAIYNAATNSYTCLCRSELGFISAPQDSTCISQSNASSIQAQYSNPDIVTYRDVMDTAGNSLTMSIKSDTLSEMFLKAATDCDLRFDPRSCQMLSNLCVLQLYDETTAACQLYQAIAQQRPALSPATSDIPEGVPWLYYGLLSREDASTFTGQIINLTADVSSQAGSSALPFALATYALNGTFLGLQNLTTQLQYCESASSYMDNWRQVGSNYATLCTLNLIDVVNGTSTPMFYDPYIIDRAGNLSPVPVRVINFRTGGRQPNVKSDPLDYSSTSLFRRFFIVDSLSGIQSGALRVIRVATEIRFWIRKGAADGTLYIPVVDITYAERDTSVLSTQDVSRLSSPEFIYTSTYVADLSNFWKAMTVLFSLICVAAGFLALYNARAWSTRNLGPAQGWDFNFLGRCLIILAGCLAPLLFWFLLLISAYWFFSYKNQTTLHVVLPWSNADILRFNAVLITAFVCQSAYLLRELYNQCTADIFFIDWERSRGRIMNSSGDGKPRLAPISVWRSIFLTNEWDDMQTYRRVNIGFNLLAMYFILECLNVRYAATPQPDMHNLTPGSVHPVLLFAVETLVWIALSLAQILFRAIVYDRFYKDKLLDFVDVLSLANLSVMAFDELCHGYYLHGRSVHPCADTNIGELNACLRREQADLVPRRGLQDTDQQCFEMFAQKELRSTLNKVYNVVIAEVEAQTTGNVAARLQRLSTEKKQRRFNGADETRVRAHETVNHFLKSFFDKNLKEFHYLIRERTYFERFLGTTPDVSQATILFHNPSSFTRLLLYGIEYHLLILYILLFSIISQKVGNPGTAALITYIIDVIIKSGRRHFGEKNLARKTMMDPKFLI